jgi:hypothetical protein
MTVEVKEISKRSVVETAEDDLPANLKSSGITSEIDYLKRLKLRSQIIANNTVGGGLHADELAIAKFKSAEDTRLEKYYGQLINLYNKTIVEHGDDDAKRKAVMQSKMELAYLYSIYGYKNLYQLAHDLSEVERVQKSNNEIKNLTEDMADAFKV